MTCRMVPLTSVRVETMLEAVDTMRISAMIGVIVFLLGTTGLNDGALAGTTRSENASVDAPSTATSNYILAACIRHPSIVLRIGANDPLSYRWYIATDPPIRKTKSGAAQASSGIRSSFPSASPTA